MQAAHQFSTAVYFEVLEKETHARTASIYIVLKGGIWRDLIHRGSLKSASAACAQEKGRKRVEYYSTAAEHLLLPAK